MEKTLYYFVYYYFMGRKQQYQKMFKTEEAAKEFKISLINKGVSIREFRKINI